MLVEGLVGTPPTSVAANHHSDFWVEDGRLFDIGVIEGGLHPSPHAVPGAFRSSLSGRGLGGAHHVTINREVPSASGRSLGFPSKHRIRSAKTRISRGRGTGGPFLFVINPRFTWATMGVSTVRWEASSVDTGSSDGDVPSPAILVLMSVNDRPDLAGPRFRARLGLTASTAER